MSAKRWDKDEKKRLIELFSSGKSYADIGIILDRSESAIRLRLQTIVYDGLVDRGVTVDDVAQMLGTDIGTVIQLFYAHRQFKEGRGEEVIDMEKASSLIGGTKNAGAAKGKSSKTKKTKKSVDDMLPELDDTERTTRSVPVTGLAKTEQENRVMETIIRNREYRQEIKKLYKANKLTKDEKSALEHVLALKSLNPK